MIKLRALAMLLSVSLCWCAPAVAAGEDAQKAQGPRLGAIVCIGDSITQADRGNLSYRYPLWKTLVDAGAEFDFVGSLSGNFNGSPEWPEHAGKAFDRDHEGHWGWRAEQILAKLAGWLGGYTPDIALVHIGTNDAGRGEPAAETAAEISQIIDLLRADNPAVKIFLAQLIPTGNEGANARIRKLNALMPELARSKSTEKSPVTVVDQYTGFDGGRDNHDGIHPNSGGEEKMARKWAEALLPAAAAPVR